MSTFSGVSNYTKNGIANWSITSNGSSEYPYYCTKSEKLVFEEKNYVNHHIQHPNLPYKWSGYLTIGSTACANLHIICAMSCTDINNPANV